MSTSTRRLFLLAALLLLLTSSPFTASFAQTPPPSTTTDTPEEVVAVVTLTPSVDTQAPLSGLPTGEAADNENSTPVQDSTDENYLATLDRLTDLIIVLIAGGAIAGAGALGLLLRTLLQVATLLASLTPSVDDDKFIKRIVDKIEGRNLKS